MAGQIMRAIHLGEHMNALEKEQLAAQVVAVMDAHFKRPDPVEKQSILDLAASQIVGSGAFINLEGGGQNLNNGRN